jgi:hypothetical protein
MSSSLDKLRAAMETASPSDGGKQKSFSDDTMWKPELDKTGNGYAVVRFLPTPEGEEMPWVSYFDHGFQGPGGWYIEKSLTTLSKQDPVSEYNTELWNTGIEANKDIARKQKRRLHYVSNVYVVSDPKNPANEGKVFKYRFGKKIFEALKEAISPAFEDEKAINPFDLRGEGANFKIKIRKVDGYWNYDKSEFDSSSAVKDNDEAIEGIWDKQYPLKPFLASENFKSYDELKAKLDKVLSGTRSTGTAEDVAIPPVTPTPSPVVAETVDTPTPQVDEDSDETLSYFSKLAEEE